MPRKLSHKLQMRWPSETLPIPVPLSVMMIWRMFPPLRTGDQHGRSDRTHFNSQMERKQLVYLRDRCAAPGKHQHGNRRILVLMPRVDEGCRKLAAKCIDVVLQYRRHILGNHVGRLLSGSMLHQKIISNISLDLESLAQLSVKAAQSGIDDFSLIHDRLLVKQHERGGIHPRSSTARAEAGEAWSGVVADAARAGAGANVQCNDVQSLRFKSIQNGRRIFVLAGGNHHLSRLARRTWRGKLPPSHFQRLRRTAVAARHFHTRQLLERNACRSRKFQDGGKDFVGRGRKHHPVALKPASGKDRRQAPDFFESRNCGSLGAGGHRGGNHSLAAVVELHRLESTRSHVDSDRRAMMIIRPAHRVLTVLRHCRQIKHRQEHAHRDEAHDHAQADQDDRLQDAGQ